MASRNFYLQLIARVLILFLTALGLAFSIVYKEYVLTTIASLLLIAQVVGLIRFINSTNRKIAYFFDAIKNEDFTLRFPEKVEIKSFKELNQSLNRVNGLIQEVHIELQVRENYYQEILKQARIGIMTYNEKGHVLYRNPTIEKLLNYTPLNHIKQLKQVDPSLYEIFSPFDSFQRKLVQLTNEREHKQLAIKSTELTLNKEPLLLVVAQDIHDELDEKETESWIRLIRVLTHEIMNTITPITSLSETILKHLEPVSETGIAEGDKKRIGASVKGLSVIKEQSADLMDFVQSYRNMLTIPPPEKAPVKAKKLFEKTESLMGAENKGHVELIWETEGKAMDFFVDEKQITQVLLNLVKNAQQSLENSPEGKITISAFTNKQGQKCIEVEDNGPGIPPELVDEIFVPFFTTKSMGTGVGLSLSKQIIRNHGGLLRLNSVPNERTSFVISFG